MIEQVNGEIKTGSYNAPASTAFDLNDVVYLNSSGQLAKATSSTPRSQLVGLIQHTIESTDDDYADVKVVPVIEFHEEAEFDADVDTGTLTTSMRGLRYDLADEDGIDVTSQGQKAVEVVRYISSDKARVKFITDGDKMRLVSYQETVSYDDFTDGGSTTGTKDLGISIPAGAVFERTLVTSITGFAGDTSATLTVGDGSDVDRYNTGTPSVFSDADAGADMGAVSGTKHHSAAKTPKLTITSDSNFSSVSAGQLTVTLFWYEAD